MHNTFKDKKILVIGGTGTIGSSLVKTLLKFDPTVIRVFSRDEHKQFEMLNGIGDLKNLRFLLGDVRDYSRLEKAMEGIDYVFHAAALKHVPSCEYNPFEAVKTNVIGTQNVIDAAIHNNVSKVIFTSTDKTISPTNTYGATKLLSERLISAADYYKGSRSIVFAAVRFGNVMGSRGSVIPLFKSQLLERRMITVTDINMCRFMMTLSQATLLTLSACQRAKGGEIFVLKMPVVILKSLVDVLIEEVCEKYNISKGDVKIKNIGLRPGEKMYEELMTIEESKTAIEFSDMFALQPLFSDDMEYNKFNRYEHCRKADIKTYSSLDEKPISKEQLRKWIIEENLI